MRRQHYLRYINQRTVSEGFVCVDIKSGPGDFAGSDRFHERRFVDYPTTRCVDDPHTILHLRQALPIDQAFRLLVARQVDSDEVGLPE